MGQSDNAALHARKYSVSVVESEVGSYNRERELAVIAKTRKKTGSKSKSKRYLVGIPEHEIRTSGREHSLRNSQGFRFGVAACLGRTLDLLTFLFGSSTTTASAASASTANVKTDTETDVTFTDPGVGSRRGGGGGGGPPFPSPGKQRAQVEPPASAELLSSWWPS